MKCRYSEQDIALYIERDLNESALCDIEAHLLQCDGCRGLAGGLRESQAIFKSLRQETVSGAALGDVRTRVLAEVDAVASTTPWGRRVERWLWTGLRRGYALAGVGFVLLIAAGLWPAQRPPHFSMPDPLRPPAAPAVAFSRGIVEGASAAPAGPQFSDLVNRPGIHREAASARRRRPQEVAQTGLPKPAAPDPSLVPAPIPALGEPPRQLVVKLLTDDPNIVIYWLVDQNGG